MRTIGLAVLMISLAAPSLRAVPSSPKPDDSPAAGKVWEPDDQTLLTAPAVQWIKNYPISPYKERWKVELTVKSAEKDLLRVRQIFAKAGASLIQTSAKAPQLSFRCVKKTASQALAELKELGPVTEPKVNPIVEPVPLAEVQAKIKALSADKEAHAAQLALMPSVSALVDELLGHLRVVEAALKKTDVEVLLDLTIKEK